MDAKNAVSAESAKEIGDFSRKHRRDAKILSLAMQNGRHNQIGSIPPFIRACAPSDARKRFAHSERKHQPRVYVWRIVHLQVFVDAIVVEVSTRRFSRFRLHSGKWQKFQAHPAAKLNFAIGEDGVVKLRPPDRGAGRIRHPEIPAAKLPIRKQGYSTRYFDVDLRSGRGQIQDQYIVQLANEFRPAEYTGKDSDFPNQKEDRYKSRQHRQLKPSREKT